MLNPLDDPQTYTDNPYFQLPEQIDVEDVTLPDLHHHYYCVMDEGHVERK